MAHEPDLGYIVSSEVRRTTMNFVNREQLLGVVRHIVTFVGGILVAKGKLDIGSVETLAGVVSTIAGLVLSFVAPEKKQV